MLRKYGFFILMMMLLVIGSPDPASGSFRIWRPFVVREDLAPVKRGRPTVRLPAFGFKAYLPDSAELGQATRFGDAKEGKSWNEFQLGSFRLRFSRYHDFQSPTNFGETNKADNTWEMVKSLPTQLGSTPNRAVLEAMGKIITPHLDLGIEF